MRRSLGARERLPQTVDRLGEIPTCSESRLVSACWAASRRFSGLQLILNHLQLVDQFLLGHFQTLGFLHELFGGVRGPGL